jgi:hypothetical protein
MSFIPCYLIKKQTRRASNEEQGFSTKHSFRQMILLYYNSQDAWMFSRVKLAKSKTHIVPSNTTTFVIIMHFTDSRTCFPDNLITWAAFSYRYGLTQIARDWFSCGASSSVFLGSKFPDAFEEVLGLREFHFRKESVPLVRYMEVSRNSA